MSVAEQTVRDVLAAMCARRNFLRGGTDDLCMLGDPARWSHCAIDGLVGDYGPRALEVFYQTEQFIADDKQMSTTVALSGIFNQPDIFVALARLAVQAASDSAGQTTE